MAEIIKKLNNDYYLVKEFNFSPTLKRKLYFDNSIREYYVIINKRKVKVFNDKLVYVGEDDWGRKVYRNPLSGSIIKDVDGKFFSTTKDGEPDFPLIKQNWKII